MTRKNQSIFPFLLAFQVFFLVVSATFNASDPIWTTNFDNHKYDVVAFYHIQANEGTNYHSMVEQQLDTLDNSGLFDKLEKILFTTSGDKGKFFRIQNDKFHFLHYFGIDGEEYETLGLLHRFCHTHPKTKVLYFHDKHEGNAEFRSLLDCYVLSPNCLDALTNKEDKFDTCGWRLSPIPFVHYTGNFWWAKCRYINKLIDPLVIKTNQTFITETGKLSDCIGSHEHSFADAWITSHPSVKPADCMPSTVDTTYLTGNKVPPIAHTFCPNNDGKYGGTCEEASTIKDAAAFSNAFSYHKMTAKAECQRDLDSEVIKRSVLWYGEAPAYYSDWVKKLKNLKQFKDGDAVRPAHSKQVYYYKDECLHPIPSAAVFLSLGLSFDHVEVIPDYQLDSYKMCGSM